MQSRLSKVLHPLAARPLLAHVLDTAQSLAPQAIHVVYGYDGEQVLQELSAYQVNWVEQAEPLGTGHAVGQAITHVHSGALVLILCGDVPLVRHETLHTLIENADASGFALLGVELDDPTGYGRIVRGRDGEVEGIIEQQDANTTQQAIREVNSGIMAVDGAHLKEWLGRLNNRNTQGEFYLTDVIASAVADGVKVHVEMCSDSDEVLGVNDHHQLAHLERVYQYHQAQKLMHEGVTLADPARIDIRGRITTGCDVFIDINCIFEGDVELGDNVRIGPNCLLRDVQIGTGSKVLAMSVIEQAVLETGCHVGPLARIRPGSVLCEGARIGNFVEVKSSTIGRASRANHLSYIGDTTMGGEVNIGAGTITCNYDGADKHPTVIGDRVFIGSASQLVAPVHIGDDATIGAGSTITRDAPAGTLTLSRSEQINVAKWQRPTKRSSR